MPRAPKTSKLSRVTIFFPAEGEVLVHDVRRMRAAHANGYEAPLSELWREALMRGLKAMKTDVEKPRKAAAV